MRAFALPLARGRQYLPSSEEHQHADLRQDRYAAAIPHSLAAVLALIVSHISQTAPTSSRWMPASPSLTSRQPSRLARVRVLTDLAYSLLLPCLPTSPHVQASAAPSSASSSTASSSRMSRSSAFAASRRSPPSTPSAVYREAWPRSARRRPTPSPRSKSTSARRQDPV